MSSNEFSFSILAFGDGGDVAAEPILLTTRTHTHTMQMATTWKFAIAIASHIKIYIIWRAKESVFSHFPALASRIHEMIIPRVHVANSFQFNSIWLSFE